MNFGLSAFIFGDIWAQSWHFVRKIYKKFEYLNKLNMCILLTLRLEISKNKGARSNFLFELFKLRNEKNVINNSKKLNLLYLNHENFHIPFKI